MSNWDDMILRFPEYSFFHTSSWAKVLQDTYNYKPYYFTIEKEGMLLAVVPLMIVNSYFTGKRAVSLPFSDYCEPLISDDINFNTVFAEINKFYKKNSLKYIEIRGGKIFFSDVKESTFSYKHNLDLSIGEENLFKNLSSNTKRNIKKAIREEVTVEISNSKSALEDFYLMNCITRKKHGLPPQPKKFFENLFEHVLSQNNGFIAIGKCNNVSIAGGIYLHIGNKALYKFGASFMKYQNLRANNLVMWDAIKYYSNEGFESFGFGITEPDNEGLRKFKVGWGTKEEVLNTYRYDLAKNIFIPIDTKISGFHNRIFSNTPLPLLKVFGSLTYRHFG
jgi:lipid II:glycine glycyltransferase (peptidoglycan interpeptide bridge formation enzyme)